MFADLMLYPRPTYPPAPDDDDFDEAYELEREIRRDGGGSGLPAVSPNPEEPDRD